ncbi:hypothetical protein ABW19_dt0202939 [Dactylella cylindrospora]|nr:hypothetical protein ABW19_dt0202939 [Dactylella cylindrospora]
MSSGWLIHCDLSAPPEKRWSPVGFWPQIRNSSTLEVGSYTIENERRYVVGIGDSEGRTLFLQCDSQGSPTPPSGEDAWITLYDSRLSDILFSDNSGLGESPSVYVAVTTFRPDDKIPFHGRELKALAVSPKTPFSHQILATGAEDTVIRFSYVHPESNELVPLTTRKTHITGIQDLAWSSCGGYLFSSGSIEEVYCWKVNHLKYNSNQEEEGIGVVREAIYNVSADNLPDLRVCGLDVLTILSKNGEGIGFLVGMVRSDSSIKLAFYDTAAKKFNTIAEGVYKTSCLLQIHFHVTKDERILMFTAGTDGFVTVWDIAQPLRENGIESRSRNPTFEGRRVRPPARLSEEHRIVSHSVHQNSIKTLTPLELDNDIGELILLTGGDDTAVAISKLIVSLEAKTVQITSKIVARAHASAVTALSVLAMPSSGSDTFEFLSSGVDQQVKRWKVEIRNDMADASVQLLENFYVAVPDVAALSLLDRKEEEDSQKLIVGGVGVEILGV